MRFDDVVSRLLLLFTGLSVYSVAFCRETSPLNPLYSSLKPPSTATTTTSKAEGDGVGCEGTVCPPDRYCVDNADGDASCVCYENCSSETDPVCGSNFVTYNNICELLKESCISHSNITILYRSNCTDARPDGPVRIRRRRKRQGGFSDIPVSTAETSPFSPLYSSMNTPSRTTTSTSKGGGDGVGCEGTICPPDRYCVDNADGDASCVCYEICSSEKDPVCGSNFVTYNNICELLKESCSSSANITRLFKGRCTDARPGPLENQSNRLMASTALLGIAFLAFIRQ